MLTIIMTAFKIISANQSGISTYRQHPSGNHFYQIQRMSLSSYDVNAHMSFLGPVGLLITILGLPLSPHGAMLQPSTALALSLGASAFTSADYGLEMPPARTLDLLSTGFSSIILFNLYVRHTSLLALLELPKQSSATLFRQSRLASEPTRAASS